MGRYNPFNIVEAFENEIAAYTGAPYAVAVDSCTNALFLSAEYRFNKLVGENEYDGPWDFPKVKIPKKTYLSVPQSIIRAGFAVEFEDRPWIGRYSIYSLGIIDSARWLSSNSYCSGTFMCLSFHIKKQLPIGKGGMILCDDTEARDWFRLARYEGRSALPYKKDNIRMLGWNMYMTPEQAARGLTLFQNYPDVTDPLPEDGGYRDLTEFEYFKGAGE